MTYAPEPAYHHGSPSKTGILLINLGTPDAPTAAAVKPYLKQFLSDPRVVEIPRALWWPILNGIILNTRPGKSAEKYAQIWLPEGSPLLVHTQRQARLLRGYLGESLDAAPLVEFAMRYGSPSVAAGMEKLKQQNCERILIVPLYPQYAASTTASALDAVFEVLEKTRNMPEIRTIRHFHDHPAYIAALAASVREAWQKNGRPDLLVMSFHGLPRFSLEKGDPYHCECQKTGRLLAEALELQPQQYRICFQSRFGRAEWLQPYTAATLEELGKQGMGRVDVVCPGFVGDCLETLEEIALEGKAAFLGAGGKEFHYIPALNERQDWVEALGAIVVEHLQGWTGSGRDDAATASRARALAMGAQD